MRNWTNPSEVKRSATALAERNEGVSVRSAYAVAMSKRKMKSYIFSNTIVFVVSSVLKELYSFLMLLMKFWVVLKGGIPLYFATLPGPAL